MSADLPGNLTEAEAEAAATARRVVTICNQKGLHARAAARFVKAAHEFDAEIWVRKNGTIVSGRSIMGLMMLAAASGVALQISAAGPEADLAVDTLARLVECKFDEGC
ncbi:MAG: HPr family phosphocarrier protein [Stellaceae bacterium]